MPTNQYIKGNLTVDGTITNNGSPVGGGLQGVHALIPLQANDVITASLNASSHIGLATISNRLYMYPFISAQTITTSNLHIIVNTAQAGAIGRILIYSNVNGKPNTKLYESANLDLSTLGTKTAVTTFTFNAGTTYWLAYANQGTATLSALPLAALINISLGTIGGTTPFSYYYNSVAIGSAPSVITTFSPLGNSVPCVFITKAS